MNVVEIGKKEIKAHAWDRAGAKTVIQRALDVGTAGEHIVCADLILAGYRAFLTAAGLPYDVLLDLDGRLLRIAVKSTTKAKPRPSREGSRICYQFHTSSSLHFRNSKSELRRITALHADLIALVALDLRIVAYLPASAAPSFLHIDAPGAPLGRNKFGPKHTRRKQFGDFSLPQALIAIGIDGAETQ
jgi:hypothetical protein